MSYYAAGAWWTDGGQAFSTQAEADAFEKSGTPNNSADDDEFARAMGRQQRGGTSAASGPSSAQPVQAPARRPTTPDGLRYLDGAKEATPLYNQRHALTQMGTHATLADRQRVENSAAEQAAFSPSYVPGQNRVQSTADPYKFDAPSGTYFQDVPVGYGGSKDGRLTITNNPAATGNAPTFTIAEDRSKPNAFAGVVARGTPLTLSAGSGAVPGRVGTPQEAAAGNARYQATGSSNPGPGQNYLSYPAQRASVAPGGLTQAQLPTPSMTPASILGMNNQAARPSSAQQDSIVSQMLGQANVQSGYQDVNSPQYNQSRSAAQGYTSQLAGLANNNVAVTGLDGGQFNQSRGLLSQSYNDLGNQSRNNVADIQANSGQRDSSRASVMGTANELNQAAYNNIDPINGAQGQRGAAESSIVDAQNRLNSGMNKIGTITANNGERLAASGDLRNVAGTLAQPNDVNDIQADQGYLFLDREAQTRMVQRLTAANDDPGGAVQQLIKKGNQGVSDDVISQLIAAANRPESASAAQALLLNAQERAQRNAFGNAASVGGGWRSQLTGQRQAMGQAAAQQADIGAQMGALRAQEEQQHRLNQISALTNAGGLQQQQFGTQAGALGNAGTLSNQLLTSAGGLVSDQGNRDASLAQSDAALLAQIRQGNQANTTRGLESAGQLDLGRLQDATGFSTSNANRAAQIAMANQQNFRDSAIAAGQLGQGRMTDSSNFATADANRNAQLAMANQSNRTNALGIAGGLQTGAMNSDTGLAQSNAALLAQVRQGNQQNSLNSLLGASNTANNMNQNDLGFASNDAQVRTQRELANQANALAAMTNASNAANQTAGLDANIGISNSNNRVQVDQNNRANSIASLQNAGVLSSNTRGQDVQLSLGNQQALSQQITAAAGMSNSQFATQMDAVLRQEDQAQRRREFEHLKSLDPTSAQKWLAAAGTAAGILGIL